MPIAHRFITFAIAASVPAFAAPASASEGVRFSHHDWEIACDNTLTCRAAGYQREDDERVVSLLLTRRAGAREGLSGQLQLGAPDGSPGVSSATLRIGDRSHGTLRFDEASDVAALSPAQVTALVAALRRDGGIRVDAGEQGSWSLSDRGASAVFLKMDEVQGRLGTPSALVRRGDGDETGVPAPVPAPVIRVPGLVPDRDGDAAIARDPALLAELRRTVDDEDCAHIGEGGAQERLVVTRLDASSLLVTTTCWMAAYNVGEGFWVINDQAPYAPRIVTTSASSFEDGMIQALHKGRGLGDCWSSRSWAWNGREFVLAGAGGTDLCRGVPGGAWDLPTYVSEIVH